MKRLLFLILTALLTACLIGCSNSKDKDEPLPGSKTSEVFDYSHPEYIDGKNLPIDSARMMGLYCLEVPSEEFFGTTLEQDTICLEMAGEDTVRMMTSLPTEISMIYCWDGDKLYIHSFGGERPTVYGDFWFYWPQKFDKYGLSVDYSDMQSITLTCNETPTDPICIYVERFSNAYIPFVTSKPNIIIVRGKETDDKRIKEMLEHICILQHTFGMYLAGEDNDYPRLFDTWAVVD